MKIINSAIVLFVAILTFGISFGGSELTLVSESDSGNTLSDDRIYELRTYTTHPGKLDELHKRFQNHTVQLFAKHGMVNVGYWTPVDQENTLIYILSHNSKEAAEKSWDNFVNDPVWQEAYQESRADGPLVQNVESVFMKATPYSQIR